MDVLKRLDCEVAEGGAPPPSAPLLATVGAVKPVTTRRPLRDVAAVVGAAALLPVVAVASQGVAVEESLLREPGALAGAALWLLGSGVAFARAILPMRGQVLPDAARARRAAVGAFAVGLATSALLPRSGRATVEAAFGAAWVHCAGWAALLAGIAVVAGTVALGRALALRPASLGAALGAAGAALAGFDLHFRCPYPGVPHLVLAHAGAVALCALLGATVAACFARRLR